ncbi:MAG: hypothetical protein ABIO39_01615 [Caulobacteraceae bacterium]
MQKFSLATPERPPPPTSVWTMARSLIWGLLLVALVFWGVLIIAP